MKIEKGATYSWVTVKDDGCGFDNKKVSRSSSGLGLRLISSLVQSSLKGELFIETGKERRRKWRRLVRVLTFLTFRASKIKFYLNYCRKQFM